MTLNTNITQNSSQFLFSSQYYPGLSDEMVQVAKTDQARPDGIGKLKHTHTDAHTCTQWFTDLYW